MICIFDTINIFQMTFDSKVLFLYFVLFLSVVKTQKNIFSPFLFIFFIITTIFNAQKRFLKITTKCSNNNVCVCVWKAFWTKLKKTVLFLQDGFSYFNEKKFANFFLKSGLFMIASQIAIIMHGGQYLFQTEVEYWFLATKMKVLG